MDPSLSLAVAACEPKLEAYKPGRHHEDQSTRIKWKRAEFQVTEPSRLDAIAAFFDFVLCSNHIVWISDTTFLSKEVSLANEVIMMTLQEREQDHEAMRTVSHLVCVTMKASDPLLYDQSVYVYTARFSELRSVEGSLDFVCRLLSRHPTVQAIQLQTTRPENYNDYFRFDNEVYQNAYPRLPWTKSRLKCLVRNAPSSRRLEFCSYMTPEDWRTVVNNCHENITLCFNVNSCFFDSTPALIEAINANQCPTKLGFHGVNAISCNSLLDSLLSCLEATRAVSSIEISMDSWFGNRHDQVSPLLRCILKNPCLQHFCLDMGGVNISGKDWNLLWDTTVATHPSLRSVRVAFPRVIRIGENEGPSKQELTKSIERSLVSNTMLCHLDVSSSVHGTFDFDDIVEHVLELNRFRPRVQAIKLELDAKRREKLFVDTLLNENRQVDVCCGDNLSRWYCLLSENPDLVVYLLSSSSNERQMSIARRRLQPPEVARTRGKRKLSSRDHQDPPTGNRWGVS